MLIDVIIGTRPEAIKLAPVIAVLRQKKDVQTRVIFTGQHRELLRGIDEIFDLSPDLELQIDRGDGSLPSLTARLIEALSTCFTGGKLSASRPDVVVVQGDTTSAFCAALSAFYQKIPVAHVEAGLRTNDRYAPFPEEFNRRAISDIAHWHFAPTSRAAEVLKSEHRERVILTGNTVVDAIRMVKKKIGVGRVDHPPVQGEKKIILVTAHRRESLDGGLRSISRALIELTRRHADIEVCFVLHLNPQVRAEIEAELRGADRIHLLEPLDYAEMVAQLSRCTLLLTDSGGLQEEAPAFGLPVIVLREKTERMEAVDANLAILCGTDFDRIVYEANRLLTDPEAYAAMQKAPNPFGDGHAAERIVGVIMGETV